MVLPEVLSLGPLHLHLYLGGACDTNTGILPSLYDNIGCSPDAEGRMTPNPESVQDVLVIIANIARILIALSGGIAVIVIIGASLYYAASLGDPGRIKQAKDILTNMAIGLVVIIAAYAIITSIAKVF